MKKFGHSYVLIISFLLLYFIFTSCDNFQNKKNLVIITGEITNPNSDSVFFRISTDTGMHILSNSKLDSMGKFKAEFKLENSQSVTFADGTEISQMFLEPGNKINMSLDTKKFDESISYSGKGSANNNFLAAYFLKFNDSQPVDSSEVEINFYSESRKLTPTKYYNLVKESYEKRFFFFEEFLSKDLLSSNFQQYYTCDTKYESALYLNYIFYNHDPKFDTIEENLVAYKNIMDDILIMKTEVVPYENSTNYKYYINDIYPYIIRMLIHEENEGKDKSFLDSLYFEKLAGAYSAKELDQYLYYEFHSRLARYNMEYYISKKDLLEKYMTDTVLANKLTSEYNDLAAKIAAGYAKGLKLYDFGSEENEGKGFKDILAAYKGKVIYLDIWSSWCGPCRAEMPHSKTLKEKFKAKDVVFVYLSIDNNLEDWEKILKIMQLEGEHYRASKEIHKYLGLEFDLQYIPHYIIFDKDGKLVKNNAQRPSSEELVGELEALL
jgi:thiol-disulfide isomerase/thioredoxin